MIDTASPALVTDELTDIQSIRWVGPASAADTAEIANHLGNVIWASSAAVADGVDNDNAIDIRLQLGFIVPTLDSGILYIYLRTRP